MATMTTVSCDYCSKPIPNQTLEDLDARLTVIVRPRRMSEQHLDLCDMACVAGYFAYEAEQAGLITFDEVDES